MPIWTSRGRKTLARTPFSFPLITTLLGVMSKANENLAQIRSASPSFDDDDRELVALGYVPSFKREFTNLATVSASAQVDKQTSLTFQWCW